MTTFPYMTRPVRADARDLEAGDYVYLETSAGVRCNIPTGEPTRIVGREDRAYPGGWVHSVVLHFEEGYPYQFEVVPQTRYSGDREGLKPDEWRIESEEWVCPVWGLVVCEEPVTDVHDRADLALRSLRSALTEMRFPDPHLGEVTGMDPLLQLFGVAAHLIEHHRQYEATQSLPS